ncbi:hypothetical protein, partial [Pseudomonas sp. FSL R10-2398]|uniref:hypothetical protein n=1 Tax=Pseudomonas sp. FSL R10-2398 TaxID=2662201 RepID=UPI001C49B5F8
LAQKPGLGSELLPHVLPPAVQLLPVPLVPYIPLFAGHDSTGFGFHADRYCVLTYFATSGISM